MVITNTTFVYFNFSLFFLCCNLYHNSKLMHSEKLVYLFVAIYFSAVAAFSALIGQQVVGKLIKILERASLIIFILSFTIFVSAISLGMEYEHRILQLSENIPIYEIII
jgi:hypothetical protein